MKTYSINNPLCCVRGTGLSVETIHEHENQACLGGTHPLLPSYSLKSAPRQRAMGFWNFEKIAIQNPKYYHSK